MAEPGDAGRLAQRIDALKRERDAAANELAAARARVAELEAARDAALARIDWAIDSIHNVLDAQG